MARWTILSQSTVNDRKKNLGLFKESARKWCTTDPQAVLEGPEYHIDTHTY